jgi:hypothetical protein
VAEAVVSFRKYDCGTGLGGEWCYSGWGALQPYRSNLNKYNRKQLLLPPRQSYYSSSNSNHRVTAHLMRAFSQTIATAQAYATAFAAIEECSRSAPAASSLFAAAQATVSSSAPTAPTPRPQSARPSQSTTSRSSLSASATGFPTFNCIGSVRSQCCVQPRQQPKQCGCTGGRCIYVQVSLQESVCCLC